MYVYFVLVTCVKGLYVVVVLTPSLINSNKYSIILYPTLFCFIHYKSYNSYIILYSSLLFFVNSKLFNFTLFYSTLFCSTVAYCILFYSNPLYFIKFYPILLYSTLP